MGRYAGKYGGIAAAKRQNLATAISLKQMERQYAREGRQERRTEQQLLRQGLMDTRAEERHQDQVARQQAWREEQTRRWDIGQKHDEADRQRLAKSEGFGPLFEDLNVYGFTPPATIAAFNASGGLQLEAGRKDPDTHVVTLRFAGGKESVLSPAQWRPYTKSRAAKPPPPPKPLSEKDRQSLLGHKRGLENSIAKAYAAAQTALAEVREGGAKLTWDGVKIPGSKSDRWAYWTAIADRYLRNAKRFREQLTELGKPSATRSALETPGAAAPPPRRVLPPAAAPSLSPAGAAETPGLVEPRARQPLSEVDEANVRKLLNRSGGLIGETLNAVRSAVAILEDGSSNIARKRAASEYLAKLASGTYARTARQQHRRAVPLSVASLRKS